jgi:hypothetical protein
MVMPLAPPDMEDVIISKVRAEYEYAKIVSSNCACGAILLADHVG